MKLRTLFLLVLAASCVSPSVLPARAEAALELYGTFHAMGVIVNLTGGEDPNQNAVPSNTARAASLTAQVFRSRASAPRALWAACSGSCRAQPTMPALHFPIQTARR
jgi:hypothetical protein